MTRRAVYFALAISLAVVCSCAGLISWRLLSSRTSRQTPTTQVPAGPTSALPETLPSTPNISTIIDLPGDPVVVERGDVVAPHEFHVELPVKVAPNAPKIESAAYYVNSRLISTDGGYMGKFPEAGEDADALARQLETNAAEMADGGDPTVGGVVMDDDGGAMTPENPRQLMPYGAYGNSIEIGSGGQPQLKQIVLKPVVSEKISDILIEHGYVEESARDVEMAARSLLNLQSLLPRDVALAVGAQDPSGAYRVTQLAIYQGKEYLGAIALLANGAYGEGARPTLPKGMIPDADGSVDVVARYTLADGIYSAGLRGGMLEPVIREGIQLLGRMVDLKVPAPPDEAFRALYARDFRDKSKASGKVIYIGLTGSAGAFDCYSFEFYDGTFRCFDPKNGSSPPLPPSRHDSGVVNPGGALNSGGGPSFSGAASVGGILAPIKGAPVTSLFGMRFHPILHILRLHAGIDFGAPVGSQVRAAADGEVEFAGPAQGFGNHVKIRHKGFETSYSHLSEILDSTRPGAQVKQGEIIALSGNTGLSTGPHLHFQFYLDGAAVDPLPHLGTEIRASAPKIGPLATPGGVPSATVATPPPASATEAEIAAFASIKAQVDAALDEAAK